jgi:hypothetical protein
MCILLTIGVFSVEDDIGTYTIKAVDDPRTLNKTLYLRPPSNTLSHNELVSLWEKKHGKTLERVYIPEDEVLKKIQGHRKCYVFITSNNVATVHILFFLSSQRILY